MAKKGNFDWANLEPDQKINHFRYIRNMFQKQRTGVSKNLNIKTVNKQFPRSSDLKLRNFT